MHANRRAVVAALCSGVAGCARASGSREIELTATVRQERTESTPARIGLRLENVGSSRVTADFGRTAPFSTYRSDPDGRAVLLPDADRQVTSPPVGSLLPDERTGDCWTATSEFDVVTLDPREPRTLAAGETVERTYTLLAWPGTCLPATGQFTDRTGTEAPQRIESQVSVTTANGLGVSATTDLL